MKKCYFIGMNDIYDAEIIDRLFEECEEIIGVEDLVEFWFFHGEQSPFIASCICLATRLRTKYPTKVKIVRVFDPVRDNELSDWCKEAFNTRLPRSLPDRNVFAPLMDEGVAKIESAFVQQNNKVERWILRQMNVVFAYYYSNLEDSVISQVEFAEKSPNTEVKHIFFEDTAQFIQGKAETMFDERTTKILSMLKDNVPQKEIGKAVGVTTSRIGQIAHKAARDIRHELLRRGVRIKREDRKCALINLDGNANALQLIIFESLLHYLSSIYQVKEFWIDEKSCNTAYGAILAKFCAQRLSYEATAAKVVIPVTEDDPSAWENSIKEYVPPYSAVVALGIDTTEQLSVCSEMIRQCTCVITDFTAEDAATIRDLCSTMEKQFIFELPKRRYEIDQRYE